MVGFWSLGFGGFRVLTLIEKVRSEPYRLLTLLLAFWPLGFGCRLGWGPGSKTLPVTSEPKLPFSRAVGHDGRGPVLGAILDGIDTPPPTRKDADNRIEYPYPPS